MINRDSRHALKGIRQFGLHWRHLFWERVMKTVFVSLCVLWLSACHLGNTSANNAISTVPRGSHLDTSLYRLSDFQALRWGRQADGVLVLQIQTEAEPAFWPRGVAYQVKDRTLYVSVQKCMVKFPCPVDAPFQTLSAADWSTTPLLFQPQAGGMVQQVALPHADTDQVVMLMMGNEMIYPVALMPKIPD